MATMVSRPAVKEQNNKRYRLRYFGNRISSRTPKLASKYISDDVSSLSDDNS